MCRLDGGFRSVRDPGARMTSRSSMLRLPETSKAMPNTVVTQSNPKMRTLLYSCDSRRVPIFRLGVRKAPLRPRNPKPYNLAPKHQPLEIKLGKVL